jgi:hypothetical protein
MKNLIQRTRLLTGNPWLITVASLLAIAITALLLKPTNARAGDGRTGNPFTLVGSWHYEVGAPPGPTFTGYETFTEGGGSVEINSGPGGATAGIGTWTRIGHRRFLATLFKQQFDGAGNLAATIKVRRLITLNPQGDELTGIDNVDVFDPAGNLVFSPPAGVFSGTRLEPEHLNP